MHLRTCRNGECGPVNPHSHRRGSNGRATIKRIHRARDPRQREHTGVSLVGADVEPLEKAYRVLPTRGGPASLATDRVLSVAHYTTRASSVLNVDRRRSLRHTSCVRVLWTPRGCRATRSLPWGGLWFGYLRFHGADRHGARHRRRTPPPNGIDPREWRAPLRARAPASLVRSADNSVSVRRTNRETAR